jgi:hypothetical protein
VKKSYSELLRDPRWQRKRLEIMERANWQCEACGDAGTTFNVHHKLYRKGAAPWEYSSDELAALCENCHKAEHHAKETLNTLIASFDQFDLDRLLGYAESLAAIVEIRDGEPLKTPIKVKSEAHAIGLADGLLNWNSGSQSLNAADCLCDHKLIDDALLCHLGDGEIPEPQH